VYLARKLRRDRIDVYLTFLDKEIPFYSGSSNVVSTVHDLIPLKFPEIVFRNIAHRIYYNMLIRAATRCSDLVLTDSEFSRQELVSRLSVDPRKVRVMTLGVEPLPVPSPQIVAATLEKYSVRRPYIFALGSTEPRKNNLTVIKAFRKLEKNHPGLNLVIGGKNWRGKRFDSSLLDEKIAMTGFIEDADMPAIFSAAELFAFPSLYEGFGLPVIEAMAQGVPVITSNVTSLPEVGGDAALYVAPTSIDDLAAKMDLVLSRKDLTAEMREKGLSRVQLFRWEATCQQIVAALSELRHHCSGELPARK
jgi:glycosyltransferase involved in cell wall biosynthesis